MKKVMFIGVVGMVLLSSCKKDWTCICTSGSTSAVAENYSNLSKKDAEKECADVQALANSFGGNVSCDIEAK